MGFRNKRSDQAVFIGERVSYLFDHIRSQSGSEYTYEAVQAETGINASYLSRLRNGKIGDPGRSVIAALSDFFGVDLNFWTQTETYVPEADGSSRQLKALYRKIEAGCFSDVELDLLDAMVEFVQHLRPQASPDTVDKN